MMYMNREIYNVTNVSGEEKMDSSYLYVILVLNLRKK